jgi:hypothetical protein
VLWKFTLKPVAETAVLPDLPAASGKLIQHFTPDYNFQNASSPPHYRLTVWQIFDKALLRSKKDRGTNGSVLQNCEKQTDFHHFHGSPFELGGIGFRPKFRQSQF